MMTLRDYVCCGLSLDAGFGTGLLGIVFSFKSTSTNERDPRSMSARTGTDERAVSTAIGVDESEGEVSNLQKWGNVGDGKVNFGTPQ